MGIVSQPVLGFLSDRYGRKAVLLPSFLTRGFLYLLLTVAAPGIQLGLVITAIGIFFYTLLGFGPDQGSMSNLPYASQSCPFSFL
jgi:MFS family permease